MVHLGDVGELGDPHLDGNLAPGNAGRQPPAVIAFEGVCKRGRDRRARVRELLAQLTGRPVHESVVVLPPFYADFGKNITLGKRVFLNSGCKFQDQGGVTIGDDCLIGHNTVFATLNHDLAPSRRADMHPAPILIGRNVWIGSNVTVLPGVTVGDNAVVAAASVVTKDVPENSVVVGSPARVVRTVTD